jgi:hypothetical protein
MTTSDKQLSTAPKLSEIAKIIDQAREGALATDPAPAEDNEAQEQPVSEEAQREAARQREEEGGYQ